MILKTIFDRFNCVEYCVFLAKQSLNNIDNPIDNGWISILQQIEIQFFMFLSLHEMIDKPSKGLDKTFFRLRNVILLQCRPKRNV